MQAAKSGEARIFQPRNKTEHIGLRAIFQLGLKADHIKQSAQRIVLAQLHHGMRFNIRIMGIGQAARFHRPVPQRIASARRHHFNRQAAIEIGRVFFPFLKIRRVAFYQRVEKSIILRLVHRAVDIVLAGATGAKLVITRLVPANIHIHAVAINNRCNRIKKRQLVAAGHFADKLRQGRRGERAGCDDDMLPVGRNFSHFGARDCNVWVRFNFRRHAL